MSNDKEFDVIGCFIIWFMMMLFAIIPGALVSGWICNAFFPRSEPVVLSELENEVERSEDIWSLWEQAKRK
jgi:hypothetical protein